MVPGLFRLYFFDSKKDIERLVSDMHQFVVDHELSDFPLERVSRIAHGLSLFMWRRKSEGSKLLVRHTRVGPSIEIEFVLLDKKKGNLLLEETLKQELGPIISLADQFDAYHHPQIGNAVLLRLWNRRPDELDEAEWPPVGSVLLAKPGQAVSGDACAVCGTPPAIRVMVADGLGSGPMAHQASSAAIDSFQRNRQASPHQHIKRMHNDLRRTRGAAVAIAHASRDSVTYCGIGNISGRVFQSELESKACMSYNGTVGYHLPEHREIVYPWPRLALFLLFSDGLAPVWSLSGYPGLMDCDPTLIAAVLYRDFGKGSDDIVVVAMKNSGWADENP